MPPSWISALVYIDANGYHYADQPTFLQALITQYQGIYGTDVYLGPDSQDGQWLAILAQGYYDTAALGSSTYSSFSPVSAQGVGLARVVKINGLTKQVPSYSTVTLTIVGTAATVINNGIAEDVLSQQWILPTVVTIPSGGSIDVTATAANIGFVTAEADTITTIFTPTLGWQTVNNAAPATPGAAVESDAALRIRQSQSTEIPSQTLVAGTQGDIANVTGVSKVRVYENFLSTTDDNSQPGHSVQAVVVGGSSTDIANAIMANKTPGTNPYGTTTVTCYDENGMPVAISYTIATTAEIQATVNLTPGNGWSSDYEALIQQAVAAAINVYGIGAVIQYTQLFVAAYLVGTPAGLTYNITAITIGKNSGMQSAANIDLDFNENPVCNASVDVTIVT